jgi:hypothetical protein
VSSRFSTAGRGHSLAAGVRAAALVATLIAFGVLASAAAASPQVNIASHGSPPEKLPPNVHYFTKIQEAVDASKSGDFVLVAPGTYDESVKVTSLQSGIYIRGMNRNTVVLDGRHTVANGIEIVKANNVWVENLTVRNFEFGEGCEVEECGNNIWWNGGAGGSKIGAHGWWGKYLTAYDTGEKGGYGIFTGNETEGEWNNIYASGFADSGIYIGACQECKAVVRNATMENNSLGYSGSNSGGRLLIEKSIFAHNAVGIAPNSENPGDPPPPQDGECNRPEQPSTSTPTISSTNVKRCTIIRQNRIVDNNNLSVFPNGSTEVAPWGVGVELPGDYADQVENNIISGNPNAGVLAFEYPNPFPGFCVKQVEEEFEKTGKSQFGATPEEAIKACVAALPTIDFQIAGNRINNNKFTSNGYNPAFLSEVFSGDVSLLSGAGEYLNEHLGTAFPAAQSVNNCVSNNSAPFNPLKKVVSFPPQIEGTWGCQNKTTPNPGGGEAGVAYIVSLIEEAAAIRRAEPPVGQNPPPAQPTMPNPCGGIPANPLCK